MFSMIRWKVKKGLWDGILEPHLLDSRDMDRARDITISYYRDMATIKERLRWLSHGLKINDDRLLKSCF